MQTSQNSRVLVVDDEPQITRVLRTVLTNQGYQVRTAADGDAAFTTFMDWSPELVITDLRMPYMGGVELCRRIRGVSSVPIIVLSVTADQRVKVDAFDSGADDYLTKPFAIDDLLARVRATFRRAASTAPSDASALAVGDFRIDFGLHRVHAHGGEIRLTPKEFDLFVFFARHPNLVISHATLLQGVWGAAAVDQRDYLRVYMGQLRKKLEPNASRPRYLVTEPWVGYRFCPKA